MRSIPEISRRFTECFSVIPHPWAQSVSHDGSIALAPPGGKAKAGLYTIRFARAGGLPFAAPRILWEGSVRDFPALAGTERTYFLHAPRAACEVTLERLPANVGVEVGLAPVSWARLAWSIACNKQVRRREALAALTRGDLGHAIHLLHLGVSPGNAFHDYPLWRLTSEPALDRTAIAEWLATLPSRPRISLVMPVYNSDPRWLEAAIASVRAQAYEDWELIAVDDASPDIGPSDILKRHAAEEPRIRAVRRVENGGIARATNDALALARGDWIAFLDHDDALPADALAIAAGTIAANPAARIVYTDEDKIDEHGAHSEPYFKCDWNRELFYAQNYLNHLTLVRRDLGEAAGWLREGFDGSQDHDFLLRCVEHVTDDEIVHAPFIGYHWRFTSRGGNFSLAQAHRARDAGLRALGEHLGRIAAAADAEAVPGLPYQRARWRVPEPAPLVSLIIPTRDRRALLEQAVESILANTRYAPFEIIVVDNNSVERKTLDYFAALTERGAARIVPAPGPFNFSAINNLAAREARGSVLGFVNNDVKVRDGAWLSEMVSHFSRTDVGAVGARLLYADGRVQHAGVVAGIGGVAGHVFKLAPGEASGPFSLLKLPRETSVVTAACMLMRANVFHQIGGFDEALKVAFNDVDLCLRARARGWRIVWTPFAELDHLESVSRGADVEGESLRRFQGEVATMLARWGHTLTRDPYYNPNLSLKDETWGLAYPPRVTRPWLPKA